jgi:AcrR family transcriptional regulator
VTEADWGLGVTSRPEPRVRSARMAELVRAALGLLETEGAEALTMRHLAERVGMRAPSIYKHFDSKAALEVALVEDALFDMGDALHHSVAHPGPDGAVASLLAAYRSEATSHPNRYRLTTSSAFPRADLLAGLEDWAGEPFFIVAGEAYLSQALWAFAHGTTILELDDRFLMGSDLDLTWQAGAIAFRLPGARSVGEPVSVPTIGRQP